MNKYILIAALMIGSAMSTPTLMERVIEMRDAQQDSQSAEQVAYNSQQPQIQRKQGFNPLDGRREIIEADGRGHFIASARMNGFRSEVLVDTGATYVAINETTARRMGIRLKDSDFKYKVSTANGITYAAAVMIDEIEIGRVRVQDVKASVSRDEALSTTLLGMSFLNKLSRFEIQNNQLVLNQ
ncbi:MAG: TIGR02281 family clan AA aspartic protease [Nitratireductor sp.]|nr:TIGR02281 family clan AA aspartic protease [Nitratireductor sp.]MCC0021668.1 TIGR02281 family clan AA aspartic protease [Nitratireductor sp.]